LEAGDMIMVHSSMRAVGKVLGGPDVVIRALLDVVETAGTVVMYVDWEDAVQHLTQDDVAEKVDVRLLDQRGHLHRNLRFRASFWDQNRSFLAEIPSVVFVKIGAIWQDMLKRQQGDIR
jgi:aminoglycoside N3'-acetyltransferase